MLLLASNSATRKALLSGAGLRFAVSPAQIDERALEAAALGTGAAPEAIAVTLAEAKARDVASRHPGALVLGADQVLALGDRQLHKPADLDAARGQLAALSGRTHHLHAGLALLRDGQGLWSHVASASLTLRVLSPEEIEQVLALEGPAILGSVGAYRLEGPSIRLFERIEGDYFTILGLPLLPLLAALRQHAPETLDPRP